MNIAILIPELGGGGAERVAQMLGDYYMDQGNRVFYFLPDTIVRQDYSVKGKVIKTSIQSCMREERLWDVQRMIRLIWSSLVIRKLKHKYKIDVAISFMEEFNYINVLSKGREKVVARVCTTLSKRDDLSGFLYKREMIHFFYSRADHVVVTSSYAWKDMHEHYGISKKRLVRIPNAVIHKVNEEECEWQFGAKAIVCMGRLAEVKQHDRIIRAFTYVAEHEPQARLIILGKGPLLNYLRGLCVKLKIEDKVTFVGFTNQTEFYLRHSRAFVMASKAEGFPNSMIEAMNCGVPVITTDTPGACGEIIGKVNSQEETGQISLCQYGILTPTMPDQKVKGNEPLAEQEKDLGRAMHKMLTEDKIYEHYSAQSLKRARIYSFDRVVTRWNTLIGIK